MSGLYVYPWDFTAGSLPGRLEQLAGAGIRRIVCAVLYHDGRQLLPANPAGRIAWVEGGRSYVPVRSGRYPAGLAPAEHGDGVGFPEIAAAAREAGLGVEAWTVTLHRDDLRLRDGAPVVENAFGDRFLTNLCPSAPETREYLTAHLADIAAAGPARVTLEACNFPQLAHGYHHESLFAPLTARQQWLLGLCFCSSCAAAAPGLVDVEAVSAAVRAEVDAARPADGRPFELETLEDGLLTLARLRMETVSRLVEEAAAAAEIPVAFVDQATVAGDMFRSGRPGESPAASRGWTFGLDYPRLAAACDSLATLGYLTAPADLERHVEGYLDLGVPLEQLAVVLRPFAPDVTGDGQLEEKLGLLARLGIRDVDFYNLGFARMRDLELLGRALRSLDGVEVRRA